MRIAITGASGFIGRRLSQMLRDEGHTVVPVSRRGGASASVAGGAAGPAAAGRRPATGTAAGPAAAGAKEPGGSVAGAVAASPDPHGDSSETRGTPAVVVWDPASGRIDAAALEGMDAVVHLAGENVSGRWTAAKKARIRQSRVRGTSLLAETLARLARPPACFVSISGVNYYGAHEPADAVDETTPAGAGFLASVAVEWEAAAAPAAAAGTRVVNARLGMVVGRGGVLGVMLPLFQIGLGGTIGSGRQVVSWIALDELAPALLHVLGTPSLRGPVNFVAPHAISFAELARALGRALHRPALFSVPAFAARLALGQMGEELVLTGVRVLPRRLMDTGYRFRYPEIEGAMAHALGSAC